MPEAFATIEVDKKQLRRVQSLLKNVPNKIPAILSRAVNKTANAARVQAVREIARDTKLKQSFIYKRGVKDRPITMKNATYKTLEAVISISQKRMPLSRFNAKQTKKGVSYNLGRGRTIAKGAFLRKVHGKAGKAYGMRMGWEGHDAVMKRGSRGLYGLRGPSLGHVSTSAAGILRRAVSLANEKLPKEINTQIGVELTRQAKRSAG
jgi:hypothetical protein